MHTQSSLKGFQEINFACHKGVIFQDKFSNYIMAQNTIPTTQIWFAKYRKYASNLQNYPRETLQSIRENISMKKRHPREREHHENIILWSKIETRDQFTLFWKKSDDFVITKNEIRLPLFIWGLTCLIFIILQENP